MMDNDVYVGLRVVPHGKSVIFGGVSTFEKSVAWKLAARKGQPYLYVTGWDRFQNCWLLNDVYIEGMTPEGDYFNAGDFEPYEENR